MTKGRGVEGEKRVGAGEVGFPWQCDRIEGPGVTVNCRFIVHFLHYQSEKKCDYLQCTCLNKVNFLE